MQLRNLRTVLLVLIGVLAMSGCSQSTPDVDQAASPADDHPELIKEVSEDEKKEQIKAVYAKCCDELEAANFEQLADLIAKDTFDVFDRCGYLAIDSSEVDLETLPQMEVNMIFQYRLDLSKAELETMDGRALFLWTQKKGMFNKHTVEGVELEDITVDGDFALATINRVNKKGDKSMVFRFVNEDGHWKVDLFHIVQATEPHIERVRLHAQKSKVEFALSMLEVSRRQQMSPKILDGPLN